MADINQRDKLRVEGIYGKGIGRFPKAVAIDKRIPYMAKCIYGYLCSFAGGGETAFPSVDVIRADLQISKDTYFPNMRWLVDNGYIRRERINDAGQFGHNIYTLVNFVSRYKEMVPSDLTKEEKEMYRDVADSGIMAAGYGVIAQAVMRDQKMSAKAKVFYLYLKAFAGTTEEAHPSVDLIRYHLDLGDSAYRHMISDLKKSGYVEVKKRVLNGRNAGNSFVFKSMASEDDRNINIKQDMDFQAVGKQDVGKQEPEEQDMAFQDVEEQAPNNNNSKSNNFKSNQSINYGDKLSVDSGTYFKLAEAFYTPRMMLGLHELTRPTIRTLLGATNFFLTLPRPFSLAGKRFSRGNKLAEYINSFSEEQSSEVILSVLKRYEKIKTREGIENGEAYIMASIVTALSQEELKQEIEDMSIVSKRKDYNQLVETDLLAVLESGGEL